jgi:uncharacterized protein (DUF302 family)
MGMAHGLSSLTFDALLDSAAMINGLAIMPMPPNSAGIASVRSPYSVDDTLSKFKALVESKGITIFAHIDHAAGARKVGLQMQEAHVLVFGHPKAGTPLMVASPLVALDLPLKVLIWEDTNNAVWVSYNTTDFLIQRHQIPANLAKNIAVLDSLISSALNP